MNILFTICGRAGSKGIKNKNIKEFLGFPLPFYTLSTIELYIKNNSQHNYDIVLNTDSSELISLFEEKSSVKVNVIERKKELALDNTSKVAVILNCLNIMQERENKKYDMVVDLDITSPLRTVKDIENLVNEKASSDFDVVFSVTSSRRNPYFNMVKKSENGYERVIKSSYVSRQEAPEIYDMNASMYAYSPSFLKAGKGIFDGKCGIIEMLDTAVLDLDHEGDFELMQVIAKYIYENYADFALVQGNIKNIINEK